jgi:hypothetical protein
MTILEKKDLEAWYKMRKQIVNGYHMSEWDIMEMVRLNHLVMEAAHEIHNERMTGSLKQK